MITKKIKIFSTILFSFLFAILINKLFFFEGTPKINPFKTKLFFNNIKNNLIIAKNNFFHPLTNTEKKIYQNLFDYDYVGITPIDNLLPTSALKISPTPVFLTFITPTLIPEPTEYLLKENKEDKENNNDLNKVNKELTITPQSTPTIFINISPTIFKNKKFKKKPSLISPTEQIQKIEDKENQFENNFENNKAVFISDPLNQPYYNPKLAYKCYNPEKFIEVYGGGKTGNCYSETKKYVESNLTSVSIMGKSIAVHKKAYPAFKAVADKLKNYRGYKINTIGSYVFRCNVNASTSDRFDLCNKGCILSTHSFGIAVDINWDENCNGCDKFTMPMEIVDAFESYGFRWGGRYKSIFGATIDPMHFEYLYDLCKDLL